MIVNNVNLAAVGVKFSQYPTDNKPEVAFAGKSNVGKSSLINSMIYKNNTYAMCEKYLHNAFFIFKKIAHQKQTKSKHHTTEKVRLID